MEDSLERIELKWQRRVYRKQLKFEREGRRCADAGAVGTERERTTQTSRSLAEEEKGKISIQRAPRRIEHGERDLTRPGSNKSGSGKDRGKMKPA
jgi:hypothetical protein